MVRRWDAVTGLAVSGVAGSLMLGALLSVWQRALDAWAGRTVYALLALCVAGAGGLILGSGAAWWPCRRMRRSEWLMCGACLLLACGMVLQIACQSAVIGGWQRLLLDTTRTFGTFLSILTKTAALTIFVPCLLAGIAGQALWQAGAHAGSGRMPRAGRLLMVVFLLAGYLLGRTVVSPGAETCTRLAALWFGALSSFVFLIASAQWRRGWRCLSCMPLLAVIGLSACLLPAKGGGSLMGNGVFGRLAHRDSGFAHGQPIFEHTSGCHTVTAFADSDYQFVFALDGRPVMFGSRFHTARTLTGYVPMVVRPACRKAALVGPEAGLYAPFFARAGVTNLAVSGAPHQVVRLAVAADAFLTGDSACERALSRWSTGGLTGDYDVIFIAPEPIWVRHSSGVYSRPSLLRYRRLLTQDGVLALHVDGRAMSAEAFARIARDFAAVFQGLQVWCTGANDWVLVGAGKEIKTPVDGMLALLEREPVFRDFVRAGGVALPEALACMLCDGQGLEAWLKAAKTERAWTSTWRAPRLAVHASGATLHPALLESCRQWKAKWVLPGETDADVYVALMDKVGRTLGARTAAVRALTETAKGHSDAGLDAAREAAKISPRDALLVNLSESVELEGRRRIKIGDLKGALKCYENLLSLSSGTARAHYGMGFCLRGNNDNENAYLHFARAVAAAPEQTDYRLDLAQSALAIGEFGEADRQFREILKREPEHAEALFRYANGLAKRERADKDLAQAVKLAERACELTRWENREYMYGLADLYMDAGRVLEGLGLKRKLKDGVKPSVRVSP